jgi:hypothetical protein
LACTRFSILAVELRMIPESTPLSRCFARCYIWAALLLGRICPVFGANLKVLLGHTPKILSDLEPIGPLAATDGPCVLPAAPVPCVGDGPYNHVFLAEDAEPVSYLYAQVQNRPASWVNLALSRSRTTTGMRLEPAKRGNFTTFQLSWAALIASSAVAGLSSLVRHDWHAAACRLTERSGLCRRPRLRLLLSVLTRHCAGFFEYLFSLFDERVHVSYRTRAQ